jgi:hypothetical protein
VGNALRIALDGNRCGEAGDGEGAIELGKVVAHGLMDPMAAGEEGDGGEDEEKREEDSKCFDEEAHAATRLRGRWFGVDCAMGERSWFGGFRFVVIHVLSQSLNGAHGGMG